MTATATKTSLKKYVRSASNFHVLFPSCSIRQIWRFFLELNSNRLLYQSSGKEKEGRCLAFTPSTEREIRQFHVVAVQRWQENVQMCLLNPLLFPVLVTVAVVVAYTPYCWHITEQLRAQTLVQHWHGTGEGGGGIEGKRGKRK